MVTKRQDLMSEIERSVSGRNLGETEREIAPLTDEARKATPALQNATVAEEVSQETRKATPVLQNATVAKTVAQETQQATGETQGATHVAKSTTKHYKNTVVSIRFDEGDYERLTAIALEQGSTAASLIRAAVKGIIRQDVGGR
jgi:hypothetical protein